MVFYVLLIAAALAGGWRFVRSPLFRAHLRGHSKDPGEAGTRVDGKFPSNGGGYYFDGPSK